MTALLLLGIALAGVDGHGPLPPPSDGDPGRPLRGLGGERVEGGSVAVVGEYASEPVNLYVTDGDRLRVHNQIEHIGLANLQLAAGLGPVGLGLVLPVAPWVEGEAAGGPALVDPELMAVLTPIDGEHGGLSLVPSLRLPLGAHYQFLGVGSFTGAVRLAGTVVAGGLHVSGSAGYEGRPVIEDEILEYGGGQLLGAASIGWVFDGPSIGTHAELVGAYGLGNTTGYASPVELTGTVRGLAGPAWWAVGGGSGLNEGIGSAAVRLFVGVGARWGGPEEAAPVEVVEAETPDDALPVERSAVRIAVRDVRGEPVDAEVRCKGGPGDVTGEVVDGVGELSLEVGTWTVTVAADGFGTQERELDVGGEPIGLEAILLDAAGDGAIRLEVADVGGRAVPGARVLVDGLPVGTVGHRSLVVAGLAIGAHPVDVQAHGTLGWAGSVDGAAQVTLHPVEGTLRVVVTDGAGAPVPDAWVALSGPARRPAVPLEGASERLFVLSTGTWTALVTSESHGVQAREVVLEPDVWTTTEARFVLGGVASGPADLRVRVVDVDGEPVEGAVIRLGEALLGQTSSGGDLRVDGVPAGVQDLVVEVEGAEALEPVEVILAPGINEQWLTVRWLPGTVRVRVRRPDGPVGDAVVLADGPEPRDPIALGPTGTATWRLAPGEWELVATSEQWGTTKRDVVLPDEAGSRIDVDLVLFPVGNFAGAAVLRLVAVDPEGYPVLGAAVRADAVELGTTTTGGLQVPLGPGERTLAVAAAGFRPWSRAHGLQRGDNDVKAELSWGVMVRLEAVDSAGAPALDSTVRLVGPEATPPVPVDPFGRRDLPARPGTWQALAVSSRHGLASATLEISEDAGLVEQRLRFEPVDGGQILVEVRDPVGRPVPGAEVACAGCRSVPGAAGLVVVSGPAEPPTELEVRAPHHRPATVAATGRQAVVAVLEPTPVTVRVVVQGADGAPAPAVLRFDGPVAMPAVSTGPDGDEAIPVIPGPWTITAEAAGLAVQRRDVVVAPGSRPLRVDFALADARVRVEGGAVRIDERVHFDLGSATLRADSEAILREVADTLVARPELAVVEVQGHTDATGDLAHNQRLSDERARAVLDALVRLGVAPSRLVARGYGPTRPIADNRTDEGRQRNRRVQFEAIESTGAVE